MPKAAMTPATRRAAEPMRRLILAVLLLAGPLFAGTARAACMATEFEGTPLHYCAVLAGEDLRLFLRRGDGQIYGGFSSLNAALQEQGERLVFAMNAGMFQPDQTPVGLYIEKGVQAHRLVTSDGPGNFGLLPNGVFCIGARFQVVESRRYAANPPDCRYASQSGPMLVIDGALHPAFRADSTSYHIRNGVGVSADGRQAWFAISDSALTFDRFARFFRDRLGAKNALYFDGSISRLYAPELGLGGAGFPVGPIVGLVEGN